MRTLSSSHPTVCPGRIGPAAVFRAGARVLALVLSGVLGLAAAVRGAEGAQLFGSPEAAADALVAAAAAHDTNALRRVFGPEGEDVSNPDPVQAAGELEAFNAACAQGRRVLVLAEDRCVLVVGENQWPFPVPLTRKGGQWSFDVAAGREEILDRRIGRNELATLRVVRSYVDVQREYAAEDRDGDEVLEYAQRFRSSPGTKDGLYWPPELDGELSPLGPLMAQAQAEGYGKGSLDREAAPEPFHGYLFRILTRQTAAAPGGRYEYVINGNMIGGFALVAWPAVYGESGIMTFIVNQQGKVYQKDLGPATASAVRKLKAYDPGKTWALTPD